MRLEAAILAKACQEALPLDTAKLSGSYYYNSLPLCVIDAVFSTGVRYTSVQNTVDNYCRHLGLRKYNSERNRAKTDHTISDLIENIEDLGAERGADILFRNRQRSSARSGILKSEAVLRFAKVLEKYGVDTFEDFDLIELPPEAESEIKQIPGQRSGLSLHYFYMLAGNDDMTRPSRHLLKFIEEQTGKSVAVSEAEALLGKAVSLLKADYPALNPRLLDHTIWNYMSDKA